MGLVNLTPHPVTLLDEKEVQYDSRVRKHLLTGERMVLRELPKCTEPPPLVKRVLVPAGEFDGFSIEDPNFEGAVPPPNEENTMYVVSVQYREACQKAGYDTSKLLTCGRVVYQKEGEDNYRVVGILSLWR